jgi:hypothetical protein
MPNFFDLPQELRDQVYDALLISAQDRVPVERMSLYYLRLTMPPSLLRASRQVRIEALATLQRRLLSSGRAPHATLMLDLSHATPGFVPDLATSNMLRIVLLSIDSHRRSDEQRLALLRTPNAPFIMDPQINNGPHGIYQAWPINIPSRPAFERFLGRIVSNSRNNNTIDVRLRATESLQDDIRFIQELLHSQNAPIELTILVPRGPLASAWQTIINARLNNTLGGVGWAFTTQVPLRLEVLPMLWATVFAYLLSAVHLLAGSVFLYVLFWGPSLEVEF